jgi:hypothetical protein
MLLFDSYFEPMKGIKLFLDTMRLVLRFNDHSYIDYVSVFRLSILSERIPILKLRYGLNSSFRWGFITQ